MNTLEQARADANSAFDHLRSVVNKAYDRSVAFTEQSLTSEKSRLNAEREKLATERVLFAAEREQLRVERANIAKLKDTICYMFGLKKDGAQ